MNDLILSILPGYWIKSISVGGHKVDCENTYLRYPPEYFASLILLGLPPASLDLKPCCIIILLKHSCTSDGLYNGTR